MFRRMPSPAALRTFEAAARHASFKAAARELGVTPTAVSHQVRALEHRIDVALFVRRARQVELTAEGERLARATQGAFQRIMAVLEEIAAAESVLTVTATPAFSSLWLVPRLGDFYAGNPAIRLQLDTGTTPVDLDRDRRIEVAIRYGPGPCEGLHEVSLFREEFRAYGAPRVVEASERPGDSVLIETQWQQPGLQAIGWDAWLEREPETAARPERRMFDEEHHALQAAVAGQGLVLASSVLADDLVRNGLLVPFRPEVTLHGHAYTAVCLPEKARTAKVAAFLGWLAPGDSG